MNLNITGILVITTTRPNIVGEILNLLKYWGNFTIYFDHFNSSEKYKLLKRKYFVNLFFSMSVI